MLIDIYGVDGSILYAQLEVDCTTTAQDIVNLVVHEMVAKEGGKIKIQDIVREFKLQVLYKKFLDEAEGRCEKKARIMQDNECVMRECGLWKMGDQKSSTRLIVVNTKHFISVQFAEMAGKVTVEKIFVTPNMNSAEVIALLRENYTLDARKRFCLSEITCAADGKRKGFILLIL